MLYNISCPVRLTGLLAVSSTGFHFEVKDDSTPGGQINTTILPVIPKRYIQLILQSRKRALYKFIQVN